MTAVECLDLWRMYPRRLFVTYAFKMPPEVFYQAFTPSDRGHLRFLSKFGLFDVHEWHPGPLPPGGDPRDIAL